MANEEEIVIIPEYIEESFFLDIDESVSSTALLEDSFSNIVDAASSTPKKNPEAEKSSMDGVPPKRLPCPDCQKTFANERTLKTHKKMHFMKSALDRVPNFDETLESAPKMASEVLDDMITEETSSVPLSVSVSALCVTLKQSIEEGQGGDILEHLCRRFYNMFQDQNALLPSALRTAIYVKFNVLYQDQGFFNILESGFQAITSVSTDVFNVFLGSFVMKFLDKLLAFYFRKLHGGIKDSVGKSKDDVWDPGCQQIIYFIAGAIIHSLLVKGRMYSKSQHWCAVQNVLKEKFIRRPESGTACASLVTCFTEQKDRGGLVHVNQEAFDFFLILFDVVLSKEKEDGSIPFDDVEDAVLKNDTIVLLWDSLVGSELEENDSLDMLCRLTRLRTKTVLNGVIKRRLNDELKKAYTSVSLRSRLSR